MNVKLNTLRKNLISKNTTIIEAIKILNDVKFKTLIIIDSDKKILGTLTDGDIRRGLLNGYNLESEVLNENKETLQEEEKENSDEDGKTSDNNEKNVSDTLILNILKI